jgi:hypothetical protein
LLKNACYDCHSNQVDFPWYAKVAPASWLLAGDIRKEGHLNFLNGRLTASGIKLASSIHTGRSYIRCDALKGLYTYAQRARLNAEQVDVIKS